LKNLTAGQQRNPWSDIFPQARAFGDRADILRLNVGHFHEKLHEEQRIGLSYTGVHRRPRRPLPGMLLHLDGNSHASFPQI
jgi:hypothetical protein